MAVFIPAVLPAQEARYRWDVGLSAGVSGYEGDANSGFWFRRPGLAVAALGRYNFDTRWALRIQGGMMTLSGATGDMNTALPDGASYTFRSTLAMLETRGEFNFFPYGIGETYKRLRTWSPYVSLGLGGVMSASEGKNYLTMSIPVGVGVKFKPRERLNLGVEFTVAKTLGDHLDGAALSDIYTIKSSFFKNTDLYTSLTFSVTYEFGERCTVCNRID
ncbi:MAG: outer membrane beta-barrel protein [Bacteroides sp.]|nr:outer membrane beta-barrel protein [Bacteroides sp.]